MTIRNTPSESNLGFNKRNLVAALSMSVVVLLMVGCATPMDARKDTEFQSYAYASNRPVVRPTRALSSFSESLICMDRMLKEAQIPTTLITSKQIPDFSSRVPAAAKDMIITSLSQMSRLSNAFRFVDYEVDIARQDTVQNLTTILLNNNQMQLQRPALYISGAIAYADQNVINNRFDVGFSASRLESGYSATKTATVIALELHLGDFRTRTLIPGLDSANEVIIGGGGQGLDVAGRIGDYGVRFNVGRDYAIGAGGALRTLIDLGIIEMVGKWARVPYWQCLTLDQTHPGFQRQLRDWFDEGSPLTQTALVKRSLITKGYLPISNDEVLTINESGTEFVTALGRFQADSGMVVTGVVDFATYERALRNFVVLGPNGKLAQVGWTPSGSTAAAAPVMASSASVSAVVSAMSPATLGATPAVRRLDLNIKNILIDRTAFEVGEQVFVSATLSSASYFYCFLQQSEGTVIRLLPNATNPNALMSASEAIRIPDWMSPTPGFIMDPTSAGKEKLACFATDADAANSLPLLLVSTALVPIPNINSMDTVVNAFTEKFGVNGYTGKSIEWEVVPKRAVTANKNK